jgi:hypothetical protein
MKNFSLTVVFLFVSSAIFSQNSISYLSPVSSPQATVSQNIGMTNISISYSSPGVKGRKIFGDLVPYNQLWRAGANSPTLIKLSTSVIVGEKTLRPGEYAIALIPREKGNWTIDLNSAGKYPFSYMKDGKLDMEAYNKDLAVSVEVSPVYWENDAVVERLKYIIDANDNKTAIITLLWDDVMVMFEIDTMPEKHLENFSKTLK